MGLRKVLRSKVARRPSPSDKQDNAEDAARAKEATEARVRLRARMQSWLAQLQRDPTVEERAAAERRALLLEELNRTVAQVEDDVPIRDVIQRLNRHWDD